MLVLLAMVAASGCGGCQSLATPEPETPSPEPKWEDAFPGIPLEPEFLRLDRRLLELAGELDFSNRYLAAVKVTAMEGEKGRMHCGGTVISPHVVLTAGHCVCRPQRPEHVEGEGQAVITGAACYERAEIETLLYLPETMEGATLRSSQGTMHEGQVQPHPELKIVLDSKKRVVSSHADLALIFLSTPVKFAGFPLAGKQARVGETVIIAGHGYDEVEDVFGWERRFSLNQVSRLETAEDERILIRQPGGHHYRQDSGGPCLRHGAKELELVGISSRWLGAGAACTSAHDHRGWLRAAIQRAEKACLGKGGHSPHSP